MVKQARRQRAPPRTTPTTLIDLWRGDLSEVVAGFLPLKSIATVPLFSRRFRDRHPVVLFGLARRHGCANAMNAASLDAIAASGRDWSTFSGGTVGAWDTLPVEDGEVDDCFGCRDATEATERYIEINTDGFSGHGGGLLKMFNSSNRLCVRQVKYRFRFQDLDNDLSHGDPDSHGLAYFAMGDAAETDTNGMFVIPTATGYELTWFGSIDEDDEDDDSNVIMSVAPNTWYDVTVTVDWTIDESGENWAFVTCVGNDGTIERNRRVLCSRQPLTAMRIYNFSPGVAHYSGIGVQYSPHTSRDGAFVEDEDEDYN